MNPAILAALGPIIEQILTRGGAALAGAGGTTPAWATQGAQVASQVGNAAGMASQLQGIGRMLQSQVPQTQGTGFQHLFTQQATGFTNAPLVGPFLNHMPGVGMLRTGAELAGSAVGTGLRAAESGGIGGTRELDEGAQVAGDMFKHAASFDLKEIAKDLVKLPDILRRFAESVNDANRNMGKFNPAIAQAFRRLDYGDIQREFHRGQATQGTTTELADAIGELRDEVAPLRESATTAMNVLGRAAVNVLGNLVAIAKNTAVLFGIKQFIDSYEDKDKKGPGVDELLSVMKNWTKYDPKTRSVPPLP